MIGRGRAIARMARRALGVVTCVAGLAAQAQQPAGDATIRGEVTSADGHVEFTTIYPGWYPGRAVHIHFKIRTNPGGPGTDFTSQLYFDESVTDKVHAQAPYSTKGRRSTMNANDSIFRQGGSQLMLRLTGDVTGYAGRFELALKTT